MKSTEKIHPKRHCTTVFFLCVNRYPASRTSSLALQNAHSSFAAGRREVCRPRKSSYFAPAAEGSTTSIKNKKTNDKLWYRQSSRNMVPTTHNSRSLLCILSSNHRDVINPHKNRTQGVILNLVPDDSTVPLKDNSCLSCLLEQ